MKDKILYSIDGINKANAIRLLDFLFEDSVIRVDKNSNSGSFDVLLKEDVDEKVVKKLVKEYPIFNISYVLIKTSR